MRWAGGFGWLWLALVPPVDAAAQGQWEWTGGRAAAPAMRLGIHRALQGAELCVDAGDWACAIEAYELGSRLNFRLGHYEAALVTVEEGLALIETEGLAPRESLYALKADSLLELDALDMAARTVETALDLWPERHRYLRLAEIYRTLGDDEHQLALLETAHASGWLETEREYVALASLLLQSGRGPEAAGVLARGIDRGVIEDSLENRALLERTFDGARLFF